MAERKQKRTRQRRGFLDFVNALLTLIVIALLVCGGLFLYGVHSFYAPGPIKADTDFVVEKGANLSTVAEKLAAQAYVGRMPECNGKVSPVWPLIRAVSASVAQLAVFPAQDLFELGSGARMNTPSVAVGNWSWRAPEGGWTTQLAARLAEIADVTDRERDPMAPPEAEEAEEESRT